MLIWLLKDGETLPIQDGARRMRMTHLSSVLARRGHTVIWWTSTFSHQKKISLRNTDCDIETEPGLIVRLLHAGAYKSNVSIQRYRHDRAMARRFRESSQGSPPPDVIVSAFPTIDLAYEATQYALAKGVPIIVDIRDLWPDVFVERTPRLARWMAKLVLMKESQRTRYLLGKANSLVAVSQGYLVWGLRHARRRKSAQDNVFHIGFPAAGLPSAVIPDRKRCLPVDLRGRIIFVYVGSFGKSYELDIIYDVARRLKDEGFGNAHFVLAGDGEQYASISAKVAELPNMTLPGWLDEAELNNLLAASDVALAPCLHVEDTLPNKVFEYLSAGLPILSSLRGEMERIISEYTVGYSYKPGDADSLQRLVVQLCEDSALRRALAKNSKDLFEKYFKAETIYESYASHVEQIAEQTHHV